MASQNISKWPRSLMEGMEQQLCFVTTLLSWTLLRFYVSESFVEKVLDLNTNLIYLRNGRTVRPLFGGHYLFVQLRS